MLHQRVGVGHQRGGQFRRSRFQCPAYLEQVEHARVLVEIDGHASSLSPTENSAGAAAVRQSTAPSK